MLYYVVLLLHMYTYIYIYTYVVLYIHALSRILLSGWGWGWDGDCGEFDDHFTENYHYIFCDLLDMFISQWTEFSAMKTCFSVSSGWGLLQSFPERFSWQCFEQSSAQFEWKVKLLVKWAPCIFWQNLMEYLAIQSFNWWICQAWYGICTELFDSIFSDSKGVTWCFFQWELLFGACPMFMYPCF